MFFYLNASVIIISELNVKDTRNSLINIAHSTTKMNARNVFKILNAPKSCTKTLKGQRRVAESFSFSF